MEIAENTQTRNITVQGFNLVIPVPYAEGHPLTEAEAAVLNQTLAENLRNNFGSQIRKSREDAEAEGNKYEPDPAALQAAFDDYILEYEFGAKRGGSGVTVDPVERKARALAKDTIKRAVQNKGLKIKDVGNEKLTELANAYFEQNSDILVQQAKELLAADERAKAAMDAVSVDL
ncbi:hypothetical protein [Idiomarina abyssalis]|uniref:hypothetical protein n=1 Tax=Idiomarina abyssalis TaxID=86102 RepID=UPI003A957CE5